MLEEQISLSKWLYKWVYKGDRCQDIATFTSSISICSGWNPEYNGMVLSWWKRVLFDANFTHVLWLHVLSFISYTMYFDYVLCFTHKKLLCSLTQLHYQIHISLVAEMFMLATAVSFCMNLYSKAIVIYRHFIVL